MSRRTRAAKALVSSWISDLRASQATPHGLPEDVLVRALHGYGGAELSWSAIRDKAIGLRDYLSSEVKDCTIRHVFRRPSKSKTKRPAASVSVFRLMTTQLRQSEAFFSAFTYTFTFWSFGLWLLTTVDPMCTTDHLHQRLVERSHGNHRKLAQAQDDLSILWPTLVQLHQRRRLAGRLGAVAHFVSPLDDGLVFGEFQTNDFNDLVGVDVARPRIIVFHNGIGLEENLLDFYSDGVERLMVTMRTYVGADQLKDEQLKVKADLDGFIRRHGSFVECWRLRARLAFDDTKYGPAHFGLYAPPEFVSAANPLKLAEYESAMEELDAITSSPSWLEVIDRSKQNRGKRNQSPLSA